MLKRWKLKWSQSFSSFENNWLNISRIDFFPTETVRAFCLQTIYVLRQVHTDKCMNRSRKATLFDTFTNRFINTKPQYLTKKSWSLSIGFHIGASHQTNSSTEKWCTLRPQVQSISDLYTGVAIRFQCMTAYLSVFQ